MQKTNTVQEERRWVRAADQQLVGLREKSPGRPRLSLYADDTEACLRQVFLKDDLGKMEILSLVRSEEEECFFFLL